AALRAILGVVFDQVVTFGTFFPAVVLSALVGGWGPGLLAMAGSALISSLLFLPAGSWAAPGLNDVINLIVFVASGSIIVALGVATRAARADRKEAERVFDVVQELALDGFVIFRAIRDASGKTIDLERVFMNRAAEKMIGPAKDLVGKRYLATSPTGARRRLFERYLKVLETGEPAEDEFLYENGQRWVYNVAARIDADRLAITFRDVTASKQTINQQNVLLRELNHRVKNVLMMAMSLARLTSAEGSAASYRESLMARIAALGRAHDLLMTESWEGAMLDDLIRQTLAPYDRISFVGDAVSISPETAISLNLALHELATNAAKYGALSTPEGHVEIRCRVSSDEAADSATLEWREQGGPLVTTPERQGLGSRLLKGGMAASLMTVDLRFPPTGVECDIVFRTDRPQADEESLAEG
ncbi:MAG TPA: HWE histidine kinase domain-containing protein, partial [Hyphomicrobium sp.]|nr:HWE histidine kinase domain-containing protein [Hyphomicrobium sp.]